MLPKPNTSYMCDSIANEKELGYLHMTLNLWLAN
jgi:hypothetical protein